MLHITNETSEQSSISDPSMLCSSNSFITEDTLDTEVSNPSEFGTQPQDDCPRSYLVDESMSGPYDGSIAACTSFDYDPEFPLEDLFGFSEPALSTH